MYSILEERKAHRGMRLVFRPVTKARTLLLFAK